MDEALTRGYLLLWAVTGLSVAVAVHEAREKAAVEGLARVLLKTMGPWVKKTPGYLQDLSRGLPMLKTAEADRGKASVVPEPELEATQGDQSSSTGTPPGGASSSGGGGTQQSGRQREKTAKEQAAQEDNNTRKRRRSAEEQRAQDYNEAKAGTQGKPTTTPRKRRSGLSKPAGEETRGGADDGADE